MKVFRTAAIGLAAVSLGAMVVLTCANVFMRYFFNHPVFGAAEMVNVLLGVAVFAGMYVVSLERGHISVSLFETFLTRHFPRAYAGFFDLTSLAGTIAVTAVLGWKVFDLTVYPEDTVVLRIPVVLIVSALALLSSLSVVATLVAMIQKPGQIPSHKPNAAE